MNNPGLVIMPIKVVWLIIKKHKYLSCSTNFEKKNCRNCSEILSINIPEVIKHSIYCNYTNAFYTHVSKHLITQVHFIFNVVKECYTLIKLRTDLSKFIFNKDKT